MIGISCICITMGRVDLLEESIECFLRQDYEGPKELLILNDFLDQWLVYDHPDVRIINTQAQFNSLGSKRNKAVEHCKHYWMTTWDDDDIHFPWRLSKMVEGLNGYEWYQPAYMYVQKRNKLQMKPCCPSNLLFIKDQWLQVGGYPEISWGEDTRFGEKIRDMFSDGLWDKSSDMDKISYVYRKKIEGRKMFHASRHLAHNADNLDDARAFAYEQPHDIGTVVLNPHWDKDYVEWIEPYKSGQQKIRIKERKDG